MGKSKKPEKPVGVLSEINLKVSILLLIIVIVGILSFLFCWLKDFREELTFIAAVIGGGAVVYGGYYTALSFRISSIEERKHRSFEILRHFYNYDFTKVRSFLDVEIKTKDLSQNELYNKITSDKELFAMTKLVLNYLVLLSLSIQENYVDEYIIYKNLDFLVTYSYDGFFLYIKEVRQIRGDEDIYIELEKLATAWKAKKYLSTGEKLPNLI